jgi:hypothetical protein
MSRPGAAEDLAIDGLEDGKSYAVMWYYTIGTTVAPPIEMPGEQWDEDIEDLDVDPMDRQGIHSVIDDGEKMADNDSDGDSLDDLLDGFDDGKSCDPLQCQPVEGFVSLPQESFELRLTLSDSVKHC